MRHVTDSLPSPSDNAAGAAQMLVAVSLLLGMFVSGLDTSIVNIILPTLQSVFRVRTDQAMMLATIYLTMLAGLQLLFGRCADLFDAAAVFLGGLILFLLGSVGCALSFTFVHILASRAIQGAGGAMMAASFGALILAAFPRDRIGSVLGAAITVMGIGTIIGPPLGGFLVERASWHWAFFVNIPLCLAAIAMLTYSLRAKARSSVSLRERLSRLDVRGGILSVVMFTSLPIGIGTLTGNGGALRTGLMFGLFAVSLVCFIVAERRAEHPLLRLSLFRDRGLILLLSIKVTLFMVLNGVLLVFPFFLTRSVGLSPARTGLLLLGNAIAMAVATPLAGRMTDRRGGNGIMVWGCAVLLGVAAGSLLLSAQPPIAVLLATLVLFGASMAAVLISSTALLLQRAPKGQEGIFSAMNSLSMSVGGSLGLAVFSSLYALGATGGQGAPAAHGGFTTALSGVTACAGFLLVLGFFHVKENGSKNGSTAAAGREHHGFSQ